MPTVSIVHGEVDSSMYLANKMMEETDVLDVAKDLSIEAVNLSLREMAEVKVKDDYVLDSIRVNKTLLGAKIISAPVAEKDAHHNPCDA